MSLSKRLSVFALIITPILIFASLFLALGPVYTTFGGIVFLPAKVLLAALVLMLAGYNWHWPAWGERICRVGLLLFACGAICSIGEIYLCCNGVWLPEKYKSLQTAENVVFVLGVDEDSLPLDPEDGERLLALWRQVEYRGLGHDVYFSAEESSFLQFQHNLQARLPDGSRLDLMVYPPYYVRWFGAYYRSEDYEKGIVRGYEAKIYKAADKEICQQLADLYEELSAKYARAEVD